MRFLDVGIIGSRGYPLIYSGYETLVSELAPALARKGHQVTVYCHRARFQERPPEMNGVHLTYVRGLSGKNFSQLSHSAVASAQARLRGHDVVLFVNVANAPFAALLAATGLPTAVNVDGLEWLRPKWSNLGRRFFRSAAGIAARRATTLITDAEEMRRMYLDLFGVDSTVITYGAPAEIEPSVTALADFGLEPRGYFIVMGRLIPDNNGDLIAREFVQSGSEKDLVILGDVPYRRDAFADGIRTAFSDSKVRFTGYVSDPSVVQALLENSAAYLHGHEFGGTNPSLVWAMGAGCRILALDTRFSREVLADGRCGTFFTKAPGSLTAQLRALEPGDPRVEVLSRRARERAMDVYRWESIVDQYERCLLETAGIAAAVRHGMHSTPSGSD